MHAGNEMASLNGWVTMSEVSDALGIKHHYPSDRQIVHKLLLMGDARTVPGR